MSVSTSWNRLVRFYTPTGAGPFIGEPVDPSIDAGAEIRAGRTVEVNAFSGTSVLNAGKSTGKRELASLLLSPVSESEIGTIRGIAMNYHSHARHTKLPIPDVPMMFMKPSTSLANPYPQPSILPTAGKAENAADWESELVIIIGTPAKNVKEEDALEYVLGYTAANDVSSRTLQWREKQWCRSKSFDGSCPMGPAIVSASWITDPQQFTVKGSLNGDLLQNSSTRDMIFSVQRLISFLSQSTTLPAGTAILTGTPTGVGFSSEPQRFLKNGDEFAIEITPGIGTLTTIFEDEK